MTKQVLVDPAPITRFLRAKASSEILVAAVHHLQLFETLDRPMSLPELQQALQLKSRPTMVLVPSLCAMGLLTWTREQHIAVTDLGKYLVRSSGNHIYDYVGLEKDDPGALRITQWLRNDGPPSGTGVSYVKDDSADSPMDDAAAAEYFTNALAGRAKLIAPVVAAHLPRSDAHLLDVAGGTGYYTYEWLRQNPAATATIADRPAVLATAKKILAEYHGASAISGRVNFLACDMLNDALPRTDILLAASLFHDWPEDISQMLAQKFALALKPGGEIWIHDAFLDDTLDGPVPITDYSTMLFLGTRGRCYSRAEYRNWLTVAGLIPSDKNIPTLMDYHLICAHAPR